MSRKHNSVITAVLAGCKLSKRQILFTTERVSQPGHPTQPSPASQTGRAAFRNQRCSTQPRLPTSGIWRFVSTDTWAYLRGLNTQGGGQVFKGAQVSLSSTNIRVQFSKTHGPLRLLVRCCWPCCPRSQALGDSTGLQTLLHARRENTSP